MGILEEEFVILCVAAWNRHHKRIDYLLNEVMKLNQKNITLLLCGQPEMDSASLMQIAKGMQIQVRWETFNQKDLSIAYSTADIFVLTSLKEGLPAVLIEAAAHAIPVICHPFPAGKYIFGEDYNGLIDLSVEGNLTKKLTEVITSDDLSNEGLRVAEMVYKKFNREMLAHKFVDFLMYVYNN